MLFSARKKKKNLRRPAHLLRYRQRRISRLKHAGCHGPRCLISLAPARFPCRGRCQDASRSEEHTSELQSRFDLVCRLLLEKKNGGGLHVGTVAVLNQVFAECWTEWLAWRFVTAAELDA